MAKEYPGLNRSPAAWGKVSAGAVRGVIEQLERRLMLTGASFNVSDYFPLNPGVQSTYVGFVNNEQDALANASDTRTTASGSVNGKAVTTFSDSITPTAATTENYVIGPHGLWFCGTSATTIEPAIHLLNTVASVGDVLSWNQNFVVSGVPENQTGTSTVVDEETLVSTSDQLVNEFKVIVDNTQTTDINQSITHSVYRMWLAQGVEVEQFFRRTWTSGSSFAAEWALAVGPITYEFKLAPPTGTGPGSLAFGQEPNDQTATWPITPGVTVAVLNGDGSIDLGDNSLVSISPAGSPDDALSGQTSVETINGVATFNDLVFGLPGQYFLKATDGPLTAAVSTGVVASDRGIGIFDGEVKIVGTYLSDTIAGGVDPSSPGDYYFLLQSAGQPELDQVYPISQVTGLQILTDPILASAPSPGPSPDNNLVNLSGDDFGFTVDIVGCQYSDTIIGQIGELLRRRLPRSAFAARISGDRFAVLLPIGLEDAAQFAESLREGAEQLGTVRGDARLHVSISVGVAPLERDVGELMHSLAAAETACKAAKDRGRNRVAVYQPNDASIVRRFTDINIASRLREAIEADRLRFDAQLILPFGTAEHFELR